MSVEFSSKLIKTVPSIVYFTTLKREEEKCCFFFFLNLVHRSHKSICITLNDILNTFLLIAISELKRKRRMKKGSFGLTGGG